MTQGELGWNFVGFSSHYHGRPGNEKLWLVFGKSEDNFTVYTARSLDGRLTFKWVVEYLFTSELPKVD